MSSSIFFAFLVGHVVAGHGELDAVGHVIAQNLLLGPAQRGPHRGDLRHYVDAVSILLDHTGKSAHLTLDAAQAFQDHFAVSVGMA